VEIHPAPIGHLEALVQPALFQRLTGILVAAVADEQRRNIGVHVLGVGGDARHALLVGQLFALLVDLLRQMGNVEQVHILKAVGLPELGLFGEHVLFCGGVEVHGGGEEMFVLVAAGHIVAAGIHVAQTIDSLLSGHNKRLLFPNGFFTPGAQKRESFAIKIVKEAHGNSCISLFLRHEITFPDDRHKYTPPFFNFQDVKMNNF
jgi:hypothetical protein